MITFILANYQVIIAIILIGVGIAGILHYALSAPKTKNKEIIMNYLLLMVIEAEKLFQSKTGKIKFAYVYEKYLMRFPIVSKFIPKAIVEIMIEQALVEMRIMIEKNKEVKALIEG
jgi:hypothetical protein